MSDNKKINVIKNLIIKGEVRHSEIISKLKSISVDESLSDKIAELSLEYKTGKEKGFIGIINKKISQLLNFFSTIITATVFAIIFAEVKISKIVSNTLLENKLNGFLDHFLFWIGKKKIELTSGEIIQTTVELFNKTYQILLSAFIGFMVGFIIWKFLISIISYIIKLEKLNFKIQKILNSEKEIK